MKIPLAALLVLAAGAAQATDSSPVKRGFGFSSAVVKSGGGLLLAQASGSAPKSSGEQKPPVKKQVGGDGEDEIHGTKGPDLIVGGPGKDKFKFAYSPHFPHKITLDHGDRIADYEFGEVITIVGVKMKSKDVKIVYDPKNKETRIELDLPDKEGKTDGKVDRTIILTGDKRGDLNVFLACCVSKATEIWIEKAEKPKTAEKKVQKKKVSKEKRVKRRHARPRIQQNRYPAEDPNAAGGGH